MPHFRLYFRGAAGRLRGFSEAEFADDDTAVDCGRALLSLSHHVDVWSEDRLVARLNRAADQEEPAEAQDEPSEPSLLRILNLRHRTRPN